jgi:uncharacterized protein YycO
LLRKTLSAVLILVTLLVLSSPVLAFEDLTREITHVSNAQQAKDLAQKLEKQVEYLLATNPEYAEKLKEAEEIAAKIFAEKRQQDAILNTRGVEMGAGDFMIQATIPWGALWTGDIMHINNKKFFNIYAMYYSHSGTYNGNNTVYESNSDGVRIRPLSSWQQGQPVALGYTKGKTLSQVTASLNWAKNKYGTDGRTPYNWNFLNKDTDSSLYCSQLVWKIHQNMGLNVDSNHWTYVAFLTAKFGLVGTTFAYAAVAPDEVYLSSNIIYYHAN